MKNLMMCALAGLCFSGMPSGFAKESAYVESIDEKLKEKGAFLPDYSYAGYHLSEKEIPTITPKTHHYFNVVDYGAIPNDGLSDDKAILAANKAAHLHKGPAVLFFPRGRYTWGSSDGLFAPQIHVTRNDYVIKGEGSGVGGSIIEQVTPFTSNIDSTLSFSKGWLVSIGPKVDKDALKKYIEKVEAPVLDASSVVPGKSYSVKVKGGEWIKPGMVVKLHTAFPGDLEGARRYFAPSILTEEVFNKKFKSRHRRTHAEWHQVSKVDRDGTVTFVDPILLDFSLLEKEVSIIPVVLPDQKHVSEVGVEDLAFFGGYQEVYYHYFGQKSTSGHLGVGFGAALNCWARRLQFKDYNISLKFDGSLYSTAHNIDFTGNPGHFTTTCSDGANGILMSCLRELAPGHHGFGATRQTKNIVYHRCLQAGNIEAHGVYGRVTLLDCNEGPFGLKRTGGGAPHHGRYMTYWNWNNARFDERPQLEPDVKGDSPEQQLDSIDFSAEYIGVPAELPPIIIGLHGDPITIVDAETKVQLLESYGTKVMPESLFETQLKARIGKLPKEMKKRSENFETIQRNARIEFDTPERDRAYMVGHPIVFKARFPERFDTDQVDRIDLYMSRSYDDYGKVVASAVEGSQLKWSTFEPGVHVARLCLVDSLGGTTFSRPLYVYIQGRHDHMVQVDTPKSWLLNETLLHRYRMCEVHAKKAFIASGDPSAYVEMIKKNREISKPLYHSENDFIKDASRLTDADPKTGMTLDYNYFDTPRELVFDLGVKRTVCRVDIVLGPLGNPLNQLSFDIKASNNPEAIYDFTNGLETWQDGLRIVGSTRHHLVIPTPSSRRLSFYFPETDARYLQLCFKNLNPKEICEVIFFERKEFISNMSEKEYEIR